MKNLIQSIVFIIAGGLAVGILYNLFFDHTSELERKIAEVKLQNDSLNSEIRVREDSLRISAERVVLLQQEISGLDEKIHTKDKQITYYKTKGRFEYEFSTDSLHRELNRIIKQRLQGIASSTDSISR